MDGAGIECRRQKSVLSEETSTRWESWNDCGWGMKFKRRHWVKTQRSKWGGRQCDQREGSRRCQVGDVHWGIT